MLWNQASSSLQQMQEKVWIHTFSFKLGAFAFLPANFFSVLYIFIWLCAWGREKMEWKKGTRPISEIHYIQIKLDYADYPVMQL
jgi:hypothetical protein